MKILIFVTVLMIANITAFSSSGQQSEEGQSLDQKQNDLTETLKNSRSVPYMENRQVKGYVIQGKDGENQNTSNLRLKQGDVITAPNTEEGSEK